MKRFLLFVSLFIIMSGSVIFGKDIVVKVEPDTTTVLKNPLNGWVMYLARNWDENFWEEKGYDNIPSAGNRNLKVSDYATTAYIRTSWSSLEPEEGKYVWLDANSRLSRLLKSCLDRGLKLSFRIVVDGRDQGQNIPLYVKEAGAQGFYSKVGNTNCFTPYADDPIFQEKYSKFINALARRFNDSDIVDFIDGYGLGKWGEGHAVVYKDEKNKVCVFNWITSLYSQAFTKVPLFMHYHRVIGDANQSSYGQVSTDTEGMLQLSIDKGYSLRHDAFGMSDYYQQWEKDYAARWAFKRPIIMEGGWITKAHHRYWIDSSNKYRKDHPEDVRYGEYEESRIAHVNMMDLRAGNETYSWFETPDYQNDKKSMVEKFITEGGYRLYPSEIRVCREGNTLRINHKWTNYGWGYCPTNIPQWNQKYKVAFALMKNNGEIVALNVDEHTDLSKWIKGQYTDYDFEMNIDIPKGKYMLVTGLVDVTKGNKIGIMMSVPQARLTKEGWMKIDWINI